MSERLSAWPIGTRFQTQYERHIGVKLSVSSAYLFDLDALVSISGRKNLRGRNLNINTQVEPVSIEIHEGVGLLDGHTVVLCAALPDGTMAVTEIVPIRHHVVQADRVEALSARRAEHVAEIRQEVNITLELVEEGLEKATAALKLVQVLVQEAA